MTQIYTCGGTHSLKIIRDLTLNGQILKYLFPRSCHHMSSNYPIQLILGFTPDPQPLRPPTEVCLATRHFHSRQCVSKYNSERTKWKPDLSDVHVHTCFVLLYFPFPWQSHLPGPIEFSNRNQIWHVHKGCGTIVECVTVRKWHYIYCSLGSVH